ncbi:MAG: hypothetical protein KJ064_08540 [Anaerolineae bacterium]|nr:hypothetical protein [Anaerolineae bacterium]
MLLTVKNEVPFAEALYWRIMMQHANPNQQHALDRSYLAWENVRKIRHPFIFPGTGFEGYYVGVCQDSGDVLEQLLDQCKSILEGMTRLYRMEYGFRSRLMATLTGERSDPKAIYLWSTYLGVLLARLRCNLLYNPKAEAFRRETYYSVSLAPTIHYDLTKQTILQTYVLNGRQPKGEVTLYVEPNTLKPIQQDAWLVAQNLGKFGHPLLRNLLTKAA